MILSRSAESLSKELAGHRQRASAEINKRIGETRLLFITDIPGQQATYLAKEEQAKAFLAQDPEPTDLTEYGFIEQEMLATGWTAYVAAQTLVNMAYYWRPLAEQLEGLRRGYTVQVEAATSLAAIETALSDLEAILALYSNA